ncbi:hypothetical protein PtA15_8A214 [Puccinia triticina]|uniref:Uncharacterized protein n=1 Tax=Puccinia triticina TaxID=208348 RepID=A0ABY7CQJ5_9BASI|nr:uncharacterized protein PtA15_8A214 [Puccinia triticina]WAQ87310.1 hypothetical protein PtA15_8A214 [Puccinia triticina]
MTPQTTLAGLPPTDSLDKDQFSWEDVPNAVADKTSQNLRLARPDDYPSQVTLPGGAQPDASTHPRLSDPTAEGSTTSEHGLAPQQSPSPAPHKDATANQTSGEPQSLPLPTAEHGPTPAASASN